LQPEPNWQLKSHLLRLAPRKGSGILFFKRQTRAAVALLSIAAVTPLLADTSGKIAPDILRSGNVNIIVQSNQQPTGLLGGLLGDVGSLLQLVLKVLNLGGTLNALLSSINGAAVSLPAANLNFLANDSSVAYISPDRGLRGSLEYAEPTVNANIAYQYGYDGTGVGIAVIDSGVLDHPDLHATAGKKGPANRVVFQQNFVPGESTADLYGHGTHVACIPSAGSRRTQRSSA
jgi:subtilisin family serine protease